MASIPLPAAPSVPAIMQAARVDGSGPPFAGRTGGSRDGLRPRDVDAPRLLQAAPVLSSPAVTRTQLLVLALTALAAITLGWFARTGLWRRHRLAFLAAAVACGLLLLSRRVGLAELAIVAGLVLVATVFLPARR